MDDKIKDMKSDAGLLTISPSPHMKHPDTVTSVMGDVIIALLPALAWGVYIFGSRALVITLISVLSCVLFEAATQRILKRPVTVLDLSAAVTGLLIGMNLSPAVPLWLPVAGSFFAIVVVKQVFGGIGKNIVNPALAARVFMFAWPTEMGIFPEPKSALSATKINLDSADIVASATPLSYLKQGELPDVTIFDMIIGNIGGTIGEISAFLLVAGGIYLLVRKVITWHIPVAYIATVAILTYFFPQNDQALNFMLSELLAGGLILSAFFMATDYVTSPVTPNGRLIYGVGCGLITVFIRYFGGYAEGASFSILIMNLLVWYIDKLTKPVKFGGK